jgi:hypothetical protein
MWLVIQTCHFENQTELPGRFRNQNALLKWDGLTNFCALALVVRVRQVLSCRLNGRILFQLADSVKLFYNQLYRGCLAGITSGIWPAFSDAGCGGCSQESLR